MPETQARRRVATNETTPPSVAIEATIVPAEINPLIPAETNLRSILGDSPTDWLNKNAVSLICSAIAGSGMLFALTMNDDDAATDYVRKWVLFLAPLVGIIGGCWGGVHASWKSKLGVILIVALITAFPLHAALGTSNTLEARLASVAIGGFLLLLGCTILTTNEQTRTLGGVVVWAWIVGWILFDWFAPPEIGLPGAGLIWGDGKGVYFEGSLLLCFLILAGGLLGLWLTLCQGRSPNSQTEKETTVGNARLGNRRDVRRFDISDD